MSPNIYLIGNAILLEATFTDELEVPVAPTTVTLRIKNPDEAITVLSAADLTNPSTGVYEYSLLLNISGVWTYRFEGTGNMNVTFEESVIVKPSDIVDG
jgi:hypothetical protein